ncbi:hypothetical protein KAM621c_19550 [Citrobacter braakii]|uniref:Uncharacterized protein n=1 Tax=Citrobacter braakii TaxID=57706 RepID=A0AAD1P263_CITBR|nr:hypothetical protein KAM621c_19550 [Citrobacter braakii]
MAKRARFRKYSEITAVFNPQLPAIHKWIRDEFGSAIDGDHRGKFKQRTAG